jgi:hypothetical protein
MLAGSQLEQRRRLDQISEASSKEEKNVELLDELLLSTARLHVDFALFEFERASL